MEAFIGLLLTMSIFSIIVYLFGLSIILLIPIAAIATVVYLIKEAKKGKEAGMPVKHINVLTKNVIEGDEIEVIFTEDDDFEGFDKNFKNK